LGDQRDAWQQEVEILQNALAGLDGTLFLEFDVPRLGSRIDAVLISGSAIFPIEFKCGATDFRRADYNQAWDYGLDLKNFHKASHKAPIFPVLVATDAGPGDRDWLPPHADGVRAFAISRKPRLTTSSSLTRRSARGTNRKPRIS
jgi:hypothetical protein